MKPVSAIDLSTVYLCGALLSALLVGLMGFVYWRLKTYPGFRAWLASLAVYAVALGLLWWSDFDPAAYIRGLSNLCQVGCACLALHGTAAFLGRRVHPAWWWGPAGLGLAMNTVYGFLTDNRPVRIVCTTAAIVVPLVIQWRTVRAPDLAPAIRRGCSCLAFFLTVYLTWMAVRLSFILGVEAHVTAGDRALMQSITYLVVCGCSVGYFCGYLAMTFAQTEADNVRISKSLAELKASIDEHAIVTVADRTGIILEANDRFCEITQYARSELVGRDHRVVNSGVHPKAFMAQLWQDILARRKWHGEICNRAKDGSLHWVDTTIVPIATADGRVERFISIRADITERKRAEAALQASEEKFRAYVEQASDALFVHDFEGRFTGVNRQACVSLGYAREELLRMSVGDIEVDFDLERARTVWRQVEEGRNVTLLRRHRRKEGTTFPVEVHFGGFMLNGVRHFMGVARDITLRTQADAERLELERKLQDTQKLESLGVLAGGIAHDFNNILTSILGNASMASLELPPGSSAHEYLAAIKEGSRRAADLCKQMLAYSGKGRFVVQNLSLNRLIEETTHLLHISISKRAVLRFNLYPTLPAIKADATQIRQVFMNLVINASEAIGEKSGVISLATGLTRVDHAYLGGTVLAPELPEGTYVYLEVSDSGCGMSPQTQARIFEPFFTTKFAGRGLGLAAVLGIVRGHNGALKIYSEVGRGTTFKLLFPCAAGGEELIATKGTVSPAWKGEGDVLVVDDEESVRTAAAAMLKMLGFGVALASDGREATAAFRAEPERFTLVLMDLTMPHMDGESAFMELRRIRENVRVILMSGFNEQEAVARFTGKGLASFLQKPFGCEELTKVLQGVVGAPRKGAG